VQDDGAAKKPEPAVFLRYFITGFRGCPLHLLTLTLEPTMSTGNRMVPPVTFEFLPSETAGFWLLEALACSALVQTLPERRL
jgi:hypothetical protein